MKDGEIVEYRQILEWLRVGSEGDDDLRGRLELWLGTIVKVKGWDRFTLFSFDDIADFPQWVKNALMKGQMEQAR